MRCSNAWATDAKEEPDTDFVEYAMNVIASE